jgi:uncharacterized membrane protein
MPESTAIVTGASQRSVPRRTPQTERIGAFSDGVFAVIITIMVLQLKPPEHPTFAALALLWPTALSYAGSYFFIAKKSSSRSRHQINTSAARPHRNANG